MTPHSSILVRRILWTEEPGGLQSLGSQRIRYDWEQAHTYINMYNIFINYAYMFEVSIHVRIKKKILLWSKCVCFPPNSYIHALKF